MSTDPNPAPATTPATDQTTVEHVVGDLFTHPDLAALGQGVNCKGAMGAGIAAAFRALDKDMFEDYRDLCSRSGLMLGGLHTWRMTDGRWIYNLASQFDLGRCARLDAVRDSLERALEHAVEHAVPSLGLPRIGCGIGGLVWNDVREVIETVADRYPTVRVVTVTHPKDL